MEKHSRRASSVANRNRRKGGMGLSSEHNEANTNERGSTSHRKVVVQHSVPNLEFSKAEYRYELPCSATSIRESVHNPQVGN